jgi:hypothetical protein
VVAALQTLRGMDLEVDKACGPIDGHVGVGAFATQSGQMFQIEMDEAAGFGGETAGCCGFGCGPAGQAEPLQAAQDRRARQVRVQASAHHLDDVVERQAERGSQFADQRRAGGVGRLAAAMPRVTSIQDLAGAVSPAPNGRLVDAKALGQLGRWRRTVLDQAAHGRRGGGVPVQLNLQNRASARPERCPILSHLHHDNQPKLNTFAGGFPEAIAAVFPLTTVQTWIIHLIRNSLAFACRGRIAS